MDSHRPEGARIHSSAPLVARSGSRPHGTHYRTALLLGMGTFFVGWCVYCWGYVEDDAFIHLEFAQSVATGRGFSFDGRPVYGDSSPLWVLLLAMLRWLGVPSTLSAKALACAAFLGLVVALERYLRAVIRGPALRDLLALSLLTGPYALYWAFSGMEALASLALALVLVGFVREPTDSAPRLFLRLSLLSVAPLLRGEFLLLAPFVLASLLLRGFANRLPGWARLLLGLLVLLPVATWTSFAGEHLGSHLPTTTAAKRLLSSGGAWAAALQVAYRIVATLGVAYGIAFLCGGAALAARWGILRLAPRSIDFKSPSTQGTLLALGWPCLVLALYATNGTVVQTRYAMVLGPLWVIAIASALETRATALEALLLPAALLAWNVVLFIVTVQPHIRNKVELVGSIDAFANRAQEALGPREPIATYAIGQFASVMENPIIDTGGIMRPSALPFMADHAAAVAWAEREGARCFIAEASPGERYHTMISSGPLPVVGFQVGRARYRQKHALYLFCRRD